MGPIVTILRAAAVAAALALPASAQEAVDLAPVEEAVAAFDAAFRAGDMEAVLEAAPPTLLRTMANASGMEVEALIVGMGAVLSEAMADVTFEDFEMDVAGADTGRSETGRAYAKIPTSVTMALADGSRVASTTTTLAIEDGGAWYLVRVDDGQQIAMLREAFPDMAGVEFTAGTMERLD